MRVWDTFVHCHEPADHVIEAHLGALRHRRGYVWTLYLVFQAGIHCGIAPQAWQLSQTHFYANLCLLTFSSKQQLNFIWSLIVFSCYLAQRTTVSLFIIQIIIIIMYIFQFFNCFIIYNFAINGRIRVQRRVWLCFKSRAFSTPSIKTLSLRRVLTLKKVTSINTNLFTLHRYQDQDHG